MFPLSLSVNNGGQKVDGKNKTINVHVQGLVYIH